MLELASGSCRTHYLLATRSGIAFHLEKHRWR